ncbi:MAG: phosphoribosylaminoimidazolesuccinocarboxamide synthase [Piscirickettsiaceae bacterium]|nr:MAG: phosphoribosylaminoimidazolesuccinocarboxamide synthase [Piscirickettsiaceae bacterium]PCH85643.1 MAG: phosphoribosylaminoimidazolesuccinocarboxamide synthase [Piscirickettsiaceae bacterium]
MTTPASLLDANLNSLPLIHKGKVRDIYDIDDKHMLIVTTDRLSAFDVILPDPIPGKGIVLNEVSDFWFEKLGDLIPNQLSELTLEQVLDNKEDCQRLAKRGIVVKKLKPLPIEAIVRGYLIGSGWKDYQRSGKVCGIQLPENLQQASQLPEAIFTPSTKAAVGEHDENISYQQTVDLLGEDLAQQVRDISLTLYTTAAKYALERNIIIADTKFEFGLDDAGVLHLIDEVLTPDSSRFWDAKEYKVGTSPASYDKQIVRDYLETLDWDKTAPGPRLSSDVAEKTALKYREVYNKLTA